MTEIIHKLSTKWKRGNRELLNMANCKNNAELLNVQLKRPRAGTETMLRPCRPKCWPAKEYDLLPCHPRCRLKVLSCSSSDERRDPATRQRVGVFISRRRYLCSLSKLFWQREKKKEGSEWYHLLWLPTTVWRLGLQANLLGVRSSRGLRFDFISKRRLNVTL